MVCKKCVLEFRKKLQDMINYRGGMGNRIDAWDVQDMLTKKGCYNISIFKKDKLKQKGS